MEADKISREIDAQLRKDKAIYDQISKEPKVLILGGSDSGKSTFLKQLKILHGGGFTESEMIIFRKQMFENILSTVTSLVTQINEKGLWESDEEREKYAPLEHLDTTKESIDFEDQKLISSLWKITHIQNAYTAKQFKLQDTASYFLSRVDTLCDPTYTLKNDNILHIRAETHHVSETIFRIYGERFHFFDVSGHRRNRKHWIPYFDNVDAIVFLTAICSYDEMNYEGENPINRMVDSLTLFGEICTNKLLLKSRKIVFLNKFDLFKKKIKISPVQKHFQDAPKSVKAIDLAGYFQQQLRKLANNEALPVYPTSCTDTNAMSIIVNETINSILKKELHDAGL